MIQWTRTHSIPQRSSQVTLSTLKLSHTRLHATVIQFALFIATCSTLLLRSTAAVAYCQNLLHHCNFEANTSSCTFTSSVQFSCKVSQPPLTVSREWNNSISTNPSHLYVNNKQTVDDNAMASVVGAHCRWNVAGDLILSPNVTVDIVVEEGIQCFLFVSVGKRFLLQQNASLSGSSISVDASFVHLETGARLTTSYYKPAESAELFWMKNGRDCGAYNAGMGGCLPGDVYVTSRPISLLAIEMGTGDIIQEAWNLSLFWDRIMEAQMTDGNDTMQTPEQQAASKILFGMGRAARKSAVGIQNTTAQLLQNDTDTQFPEQNNLYTRGGGRIRIVASRDLVVMDKAAITADGDSAVSGIAGGSGGSVYLSATAVSITNGRIRARGGDAFCTSPLLANKSDDESLKLEKDGDTMLEAKDCSPAGGGGRIMIAYQSSELNNADSVDTTGGNILSVKNYEKCMPSSLASQLTGATGTFFKVVYSADHMVSESNIIISNRQQPLSIINSSNDFLRNLMAPTPFIFPSNDEMDEIRDWSTTDVMIQDGAFVVTNGLPPSTARENLSSDNTFGSFRVINSSVLIAAIKVYPSDSTRTFPEGSEGSFAGSIETSQRHSSIVRLNARDIAMQNQSRWLVMTDVAAHDSVFEMDTAETQMEIRAQTFATDASVSIEFEGELNIWTSYALNFDANVSTGAPIITNATSLISGSQRLKLYSGEDVFLGGNFHVGSLYVRSEHSIFLIHGSIDAKLRTQLDARFTACDDIFIEQSNFTLVLNAGKSISIGYDRQVETSNSAEQDTASKTLLLGSAIQICAVDRIEISAQTVISSNGRGAQANQGAGHGNCMGSVGGGAGYGGRGADSNPIDSVGDYASGGLIYGSKSGEGLVGSGGGCTGGGSGGGIIRLGASSLELNGQLHCDGASGVHGAGGGSGGFLGITIATHLTGDGNITATGGTATCIPIPKKTADANLSTPTGTFLVGSTQDEAVTSTTASPKRTQVCGGGGGGGRLQLRGCKKSNYDQCTHDFDGDYTVHGGATLTSDATPAEASPTVEKSETGVSPSPTYTNNSSSSSPLTISKLTKSGSDGSFFGFPCPPGYGGLFCRVCPVGTYKSESNSEECKACHNAPANSHYVGPSGATSTHCPWACDPGYTGRTRCVSPLQQLLDTFGGEVGCGIVLMGIVLFFILLGYACRNRKEPSTMYTHHVNHEFFFSGTGSNDSISMLPSTKAERQRLLVHTGLMTPSDSMASGEWFRCTSILCCWLPPLVRCISWAHVKYPKLMERDLPEHMARLYFAGTNDRHCPLRLRTTVPPNLDPVLYGKEFEAFANKINAALGWPRLTNLRQMEVSKTEQVDPLGRSFGRAQDNPAIPNSPSKVCCCCHSWGDVLYRFMSLFCYPLAANVLQYRRHVRMNALKQMIAKYNHAFMKGPRARGLLNAVKLGYSSDDYSLVYLELLFKESFQSTCVPTNGNIGKPALPIVLLFAGRGTYRSPLYLDPNDLLVRSIPQCPELTAFIDEQWIEIVSELNTLLRCVVCQDWGIVQTLLPVARFLETINARNLQSQTNRLGGLCMHLGRFYVQDPDEMGADGSEECKLGLFLTTSNSSGTLTTSSNKGESKSRKNASFLSGRAYTGYNVAFKNKDSSVSSRERRRSPENAKDAWCDLATSSSPSSPSTSNPSMARSRIRAEALRLRSTTSGEEFDKRENQATRRNGHEQSQRQEYPKLTKLSHVRHGHPGVYKIWQGPIDTSLPVAGVLITSTELEDRLIHQSRINRVLFVLHRYLLPCNVPLRPLQCLHHRTHRDDERDDQEEKPNLRNRFTAMGGKSSPILTSALYGAAANPTLLSSVSWILHITLLCLLMMDLAITFATIANMKCVNNGQVDINCSVSILIPIMLFPVPLAIIIAPVTGISSLALSSPQFSRQYAIWNMFSIVNVGIAALCGILNTSRLVAPWFAGSFPILPMLLLAVKFGEAYIVERYIAFQETYRRRRGWRGLMKRRLSDASNSGISPSMSPPETP